MKSRARAWKAWLARTKHARTQTPAGRHRPTRACALKPDPFQLEALAALEYEDVLVTAPTGSGKTWIAREEIRRLLASGRRAWYTSPLKALTNSKLQSSLRSSAQRMWAY